MLHAGRCPESRVWDDHPYEHWLSYGESLWLAGARRGVGAAKALTSARERWPEDDIAACPTCYGGHRED